MKKSEAKIKQSAELPQCDLSRRMEAGIQRHLEKAYEIQARKLNIPTSDVLKVQDLSVRVILCVETKHKVRKQFYNFFKNKGYPKDFPVRVKNILLFQNIDGADVVRRPSERGCSNTRKRRNVCRSKACRFCSFANSLQQQVLFGMYVYEYGHDCPMPNRRHCYISYLDSVYYFEPRTYRTTVYHALLVEYLRVAKERGFHTCHLWSCPPAKGDDYIFYVHPKEQEVPKPDRLCAWYVGERAMRTKTRSRATRQR